MLEENGYKVFDYKDFLWQRGPPLSLSVYFFLFPFVLHHTMPMPLTQTTDRSNQSRTLPLDRLLKWRAPVAMSPTERLFANAVETGPASTARSSGMIDPTSNMPLQPQLQLSGTSSEASSMDYLSQNLTNCDEMVDLELVI